MTTFPAPRPRAATARPLDGAFFSFRAISAFPCPVRPPRPTSAFAPGPEAPADNVFRTEYDMRRRPIAALAAALVLFLSLAALAFLTGAQPAEAARLGGGRSFGGGKLFSTPYKAPSTPSGSGMRQSAPSQSAPNAAPRPSRFGGLGGMFGGLLMGGLLGSLLFGGGFSGINFMDILLIGGGIFLLMKLLRGRRPATAREPAYAGASYRDAAAQYDAGGRPDGWAGLSSGAGAAQGTPAMDAPVPPGFDQEEFLDGAKAAYVRLQGSWDRRDLDDVRRFTEPDVYEEIARQAEEDPNPGRTEILLLEARLLEVKTENGATLATVYFDALLREDAARETPEQTREVWRFTRRENEPNPEWKLAGIQQLEN